MVDEEQSARASLVGGVIGHVPEECEQAVGRRLRILRRCLPREL